ncbi:MAG: hypothetical protein ACQESR_17605, partial [Planctomycetota bacterium]
PSPNTHIRGLLHSRGATMVGFGARANSVDREYGGKCTQASSKLPKSEHPHSWSASFARRDDGRFWGPREFS